MADEKNVDVRIRGDSSQFSQATQTGGRDAQRFSREAHSAFRQAEKDAHEFQKSIDDTIKKWAAMVGAGKLAHDAIKSSGDLLHDQRKLQVQLGASRDEMDALTAAQMAHQQATGQSVEAQMDLARALEGAGNGYDAILKASGDAAKFMAAAALDGGATGEMLGTLQQQFKLNIGDSQQLRGALEQVMAAGNPDQLRSFLERVGTGAKAANLDLGQTLGLYKSLSAIAPKNRAQVTDALTSLFTDKNRMKALHEATGMRFFDKAGKRLPLMEQLEKVEAKYKTLKTEKDKQIFLFKAFGSESEKFKEILDSGTIGKWRDAAADVANSAGTFDDQIKTSIDNSIDQVSRLGGALRQTVHESFGQPVNDAISGVVKKLMDSKDQGGFGLTGNQMAGGMAAGMSAILAIMLGVKKFGGKGGMPSIPGVGQAGNVAAGVAQGKALEQMGVTPVFVVNMPKGGMLGDGLPGAADLVTKGGTAGKVAKLARMGGAAKGLALIAGVLGLVEAGVTELDGSLSRKDKNREHAGNLGGMVGTVAGGALGSLAGPIGTAIGAAAGNWLGRQAGDWVYEQAQKSREERSVLQNAAVGGGSAIAGTALGAVLLGPLGAMLGPAIGGWLARRDDKPVEQDGVDRMRTLALQQQIDQLNSIGTLLTSGDIKGAVTLNITLPAGMTATATTTTAGPLVVKPNVGHTMC